MKSHSFAAHPAPSSPRPACAGTLRRKEGRKEGRGTRNSGENQDLHKSGRKEGRKEAEVGRPVVHPPHRRTPSRIAACFLLVPPRRRRRRPSGRGRRSAASAHLTLRRSRGRGTARERSPVNPSPSIHEYLPGGARRKGRGGGHSISIHCRKVPTK